MILCLYVLISHNSYTLRISGHNICMVPVACSLVVTLHAHAKASSCEILLNPMYVLV